MTKLLSFASKPKLAVGKAIELSQFRPKEIMAIGRKNLVFSKFNDWLLAARKANSINPHALFWRGIALQYPLVNVVANLDKLIAIAGGEPDLADQVQAIALSVPAKKLPGIKSLRQLSSEMPEQAHIRTMLVRKKILGDEAFIRKHFFQSVREVGDGVISFTLENGRTVQRNSSIFQEKDWEVRKYRSKTVYGQATIIAVHAKPEGVNPIFLLVDGDFLVRKVYPAEYHKISLVKN